MKTNLRKVCFPVIVASMLVSSLSAQTYSGKSNKLKLDFRPTAPTPVVIDRNSDAGQSHAFPNLQLVEASIKTSDNNGNGILEANEWFTLDFSVKNTGEGIANGVRIEVRELTGLTGLEYTRSEVVTGGIPPGPVKLLSVNIKANSDVADGLAQFGVTVVEPSGFGINEFIVEMPTKKFDPPQLVVTTVEFKNRSGTYELAKKETVVMEVTIANTGKADAENVDALFALPPDAYPDRSPLMHHLYTIPAGQTTQVRFQFITNNNYQYAEVPVLVKLTESFQKYGYESTFNALLDGTSQGPLVVNVADVDKDLPVTQLKKEDAIAVIIGNKDYMYTKSVDYAINDANSVKRYCMEVLGFLESNIIYRPNASKANFDEIFGNQTTYEGLLHSRIKPNITEVFVFYSGHGAPDVAAPGTEKPAYFIPVDCNPNINVRLTGYPTEVFYENLNKLRAKSVTVVLDACFSGENVIENASPVYIQSKGVKASENLMILASSKGNQISSWYPEKSHGLFTYFFLKAIHNKNADVNKDDAISLEEIYGYLSDDNNGVPYKARELYPGRKQDPDLNGIDKNRILVRFK